MPDSYLHLLFIRAALTGWAVNEESSRSRNNKELPNAMCSYVFLKVTITSRVLFVLEVIQTPFFEPFMVDSREVLEI